MEKRGIRALTFVHGGIFAKSKRAQITIFIIIAVVIVAGVILVFSLNPGLREGVGKILSGEVFYPDEVERIDGEIEGCVLQSLNSTLRINSMQGGYYYVDEGVLVDAEFLEDVHRVPYYLVDSERDIPSVNVLEDEISFGVENEIEKCWVDYDSVGFDFDVLDAESKVGEGFVDVVVSIPVSVNFEDEVYVLDDFEAKVESDYRKLYGLAVEATSIQAVRDDICLSCLNEIANENEVVFRNQEFEDGSYYIVYEIQEINGEEVWKFAHVRT